MCRRCANLQLIPGFVVKDDHESSRVRLYDQIHTHVWLSVVFAALVNSNSSNVSSLAPRSWAE